MSNNEVLVLGAMHTAIGSFGGTLKDVPLTMPAKTAGSAAMKHAGVDPNGSGISLGHPVSTSGAIIATKAIHELHCIGRGQGIAAVFERLQALAFAVAMLGLAALQTRLLLDPRRQQQG